MPPKGLWTIARHHGHGGKIQRQSFNSNDFPIEEEEMVQQVKEPAITTDGMTDAIREGEGERKQKKKQKKKNKRHLFGQTAGVAVPLPEHGVRKSKKKQNKISLGNSDAAADAQPEEGDDDKKKKGKKHSLRKSDGVSVNKLEADSEAAVATPETSELKGKREQKSNQKMDCEAAAAELSTKKHKMWYSEDTAEQPSVKKWNHKDANVQEPGSSKEKVKQTNKHVLGMRAAEEAQSSRKKRKRASEVACMSVTPQDRPTGAFPIGDDFAHNVWAAVNSRDASVVESTEVQYELDKPKTKKKKSSSKKSLEVQSMAKDDLETTMKDSAPVLVKKLKDKKHRKSDSLVGYDGGLRTPNSAPKATPHLASTHTGSPTVLVPETPPTKTPHKASNFSTTPVPIKLPKHTRFSSTGTKLSNKERTKTPLAIDDGPRSAPATTVRSRSHVPLPSVPNALTDANLNRHTQPLSDNTTKSKSLCKVASSATSTSSNSIKDMFARVGKSQNDPIVDHESDKISRKREDPSANVFGEKFRALQDTVVFSEEHRHLKDFLIWGIENDAVPPCLGNATGCTVKKEEILRLGKDESLIIYKLDFEGSDPRTITEAKDRARNAEELLMLSIRAQVPVPIGDLGGTWTLYCPKYAETHFDRYGYGQRTLTITPIAGFKHRNSYTGRLSIPPRTMAYTILAFLTPPHASFRTTTIKTAAEGYTMEVVFLGNGYLQMRVDLKLLLKGKATEEVEGKKMHMEFIGIHENAVDWWRMDKDVDEVKGNSTMGKHHDG